MSDVTILSACYGKYDTVKAPVPQKNLDVDWVLVTDEPDIVAPGWRVIVERRPHLHPNVAAKIPKFRPDLYCDTKFSIWADASAIIQPSFAARIVSKIKPATWAMFPHPNRDNITDEVTASRGLPKYDDLDLEGQVQFYLNQGHINNYGLWATGIIGRDRTALERDIHFGNEWLMQVNRFGFQDQLSFPFLARLFGLEISPIARDLWSNDIVWFDGHGRG